MWLAVAALFAFVLWSRGGPTVRMLSQLPPRLARWAPALGAAAATCPSDFPGGASSWALFCAAVMEEESQGGDAPGYSPRGVWAGEGDNGNAVTPWQLDKRYHAAFLNQGPRDPLIDSVYAMGLLAERWMRFGDPAATAAAYNASEERVQAALDAGTEVNLTTTPRKGRYVYASEIVQRWQGWCAT